MSPPERSSVPTPTLEISALEESRANETSDLFTMVVVDLPYYNDLAKRSEISKYQSDALVSLQTADPDSVLIAKLEGKVVGFCFSNQDDGLIWLSWFGVAPSCRRMGVGAALIAALAERARRVGSHKIWCDSRTTNTASAQLLAKVGFHRICTLESHWYGQDFFLWELFIG